MALISASVIAATSDNLMSPWYCHGIDCPAFTNSTITGVEVRQYDSFLWASTNVSGTSFDDAENIGFDRLFDYISGANSDDAQVDMTSPGKTLPTIYLFSQVFSLATCRTVLNQVVPGQGPNCNSTFVVSFFVPYAYQPSVDSSKPPPTPSSPDVYVSTIGPLTVAVSEFGGFASQKEIIARAAALEQAVTTAPGLQASSSDSDESWYFAG